MSKVCLCGPDCVFGSGILSFLSSSVTVWESLQLPLLYGISASIGNITASALTFIRRV